MHGSCDNGNWYVECHQANGDAEIEQKWDKPSEVVSMENKSRYPPSTTLELEKVIEISNSSYVGVKYIIKFAVQYDSARFERSPGYF